MDIRRWKRAVVCLLASVILTSCSSGRSLSSTGGSGKQAGSGAVLSASSVSQPVPDIAAEAQKLSKTPGCVALAEIICQLDSSNHLEDLVQKNDAQHLFEILRETASQKSLTLETIDTQYDLKDILASEGIFVSISSNAVTSLPAGSRPADSSWIPKFQSAASAKAASHP